jgi:polyferredoxin
MSAEAIHDFMSTPYGLVADVKMLNFFRDIGQTAAIVIALLVLLSMLVQNFWCRYLCPYGALLGIASLLSPVKIRRDAEACIDCGKCARVCPSHLPVDRLVQIRSVECTACMACVAACPAQDALQFSLVPRKAPTPLKDGGDAPFVPQLCRCSCVHLLRSGGRCEGDGPLADESAA